MLHSLCYFVTLCFFILVPGMTLEPGKLYTEVMGDEVHLSMASLESRKDFGKNHVIFIIIKG